MNNWLSTESIQKSIDLSNEITKELEVNYPHKIELLTDWKEISIYLTKKLSLRSKQVESFTNVFIKDHNNKYGA
jgi:hypothetical protein